MILKNVCTTVEGQYGSSCEGRMFVSDPSRLVFCVFVCVKLFNSVNIVIDYFVYHPEIVYDNTYDKIIIINESRDVFKC